MARKAVEPDFVIINDAADANDYYPFVLQTSAVRSVAQVGEVRRYAGGRYRAISRIGKQKGYVADFKALTPDQVTWLENKVGRVVCLRDFSGLKLFAVYFEVSSEGIRGSYLCNVSLTLQGVTYTESVI